MIAEKGCNHESKHFIKFRRRRPDITEPAFHRPETHRSYHVVMVVGDVTCMDTHSIDCGCDNNHRPDSGHCFGEEMMNEHVKLLKELIDRMEVIPCTISYISLDHCKGLHKLISDLQQEVDDHEAGI